MKRGKVEEERNKEGMTHAENRKLNSGRQF